MSVLIGFRRLFSDMIVPIEAGTQKLQNQQICGASYAASWKGVTCRMDLFFGMKLLHGLGKDNPEPFCGRKTRL